VLSFAVSPLFLPLEAPADTKDEAMATATETASTNQVKVEDVGPARKRLTITVPASAVSEKIEESLGTLATQTVLPGFRKGKAPRNLLERKFGDTLRSETKNQLIASAYAAAIEEHQLKPVGDPEPGEGMEDLKVEAGKPLTFSVDVEVVPEFELPPLEGLEIKRPLLEITQQHIDDEVKRQQLQNGASTKVEDDFVEDDRLGGYAAVTKNDEEEPFFRQDNVLIVYPGKEDGGKGQVLGLMIDGLHDLLKGKKVGDTITITTTGPEAHERDDLRGAKISIAYEIRAADRITPASAEEVAAKYGLPSEEILREQIKMALEHRRDEEQATAMREQAIEHLADMVKFDLPEKLSAQQASRTLERHRLELLYRGVSQEEVENALAELRDDNETLTRRRLKMQFLLHRLAEHFKIEVSEQEVNGRIAAIAGQSNMRPEKLRSDLIQAGRIGEVAGQLRDQKAADRLISMAKKVDVTAEEWNKHIRGQQANRTSRKSPAKQSKSTKPEAEGKTAENKPEKKAAAPKKSAPKKSK
jgi:trigger factor